MQLRIYKTTNTKPFENNEYITACSKCNSVNVFVKQYAFKLSIN